jgi:ribosomal protein RSM22 (predicted rRNA methylase)
MKKTLHQFLDSYRSKGNLKTLKGAFEAIRRKYSTVIPSKMLSGKEEHLAYMLYRMPATYAATHKSLEYLKETLPEFFPKTVLDLGTGPGTALLAALDVFPCIEKGIGLERNDDFLSLWQECFSFFEERRVDFSRFSLENSYPDSPFDLVLSSYTYGELDKNTQQKWLAWAQKNAKVLLIVEPGTPEGWENILSARASGKILAPCPHAQTCPMKQGNHWCHQAIRLPRTSLHRNVKQGSLGYEDEKFCYISLLFDPSLATAVPACRIVNTPRHRCGHTYLSLCTKKATLEERIISRKRKDLYALAKRARWGDSFPNPDN